MGLVEVGERAAAPLRARGLAAVPRRLSVRLAWAAALAGALLPVALLALAVGARDVSLATVWAALTARAPGLADHLVVRNLRLPRLLTGLAAGAALGVAGVLMQALTCNPLADPGLLGVNAEACLAVVLSIYVLSLTASGVLVGPSFAGAAVVSAAAYALGSLAGAGAALTSRLLAVLQRVLLSSPDTLDPYRFRGRGPARRHGGTLDPVAPAGAGARGPARALDLGLAQRRGARERGGARAGRPAGPRADGHPGRPGAPLGGHGGGACRLRGPRAAARGALMGLDQRICVGAALLLGPILVGAEVLGRVVLPPGEVRVGIMTGLIGGPLFALVVRRMRVMAP